MSWRWMLKIFLIFVAAYVVFYAMFHDGRMIWNDLAEWAADDNSNNGAMIPWLVWYG